MIRLIATVIAAGVLPLYVTMSNAGVLAISNTQRATVVLTSDACEALPGWGVARLADSYGKVEARGCWQLRDNGAVVAKFLPEWKDIFYDVGTFRWLPNIQFTQNK